MIMVSVALAIATAIFNHNHHIVGIVLCINLIVAPCIFCRIASIYQPKNAHIISHKTLLKHFKSLRHVSILSDYHQGALFLAKVMLQYSQFNSYLQMRCCGSITCCVGMCCGAVARCASYACEAHRATAPQHIPTQHEAHRATAPRHIPTQHDMLPQHLVCKYELNCEYCNITLARKKAP